MHKKCSYPGCEMHIEVISKDVMPVCSSHETYLDITGIQLGICPVCNRVSSILKWNDGKRHGLLFIELHKECEEMAPWKAN
jgi:hypothetical protein